MPQRLQIRTGWISFAAVLAGIAGVYNLVCGIAAASSDDALQQRAQALFNVDLTTLGWIWIVLGAVQLFTAIQIWRRIHSGLVLGVVWCGINAALTTLAIFTYPLWAILMFALQISILYGLLGHADEFEQPRMPRSRRHPSLGYRAEQTGLLVAAANAPLTFQRTLMPRTTADQAVVTGLSFAANHALASLIQESLQSLALLLAGDARKAPLHERRWSRASLAVDAGAIAAGIGLQRVVAARPNERLPRAGARAGGFLLAATGLGGLIIGGLQEELDRRKQQRVSQFVVVPAAAGLAVGGELLRRRRQRLDDPPAEEAEISVVKSLAMSVAVAGITSAISAGERKLADRIARAAGRVLPGNEALWRPLGHAASLAALGAGTRFVMQHGFGMIESREEAVEPSFDLPPPHPYLSGSLDSHVAYATLSKQGRRYVWNAQASEVISEVMGEDAIDVIRVYVGLESADGEAARVALAMRELERTNAFDREWLLIDMPTGTGYVNYAAVSVMEMLARGNCATIAMQYAARPSPLSLDRVDEGRRQARLLIDAIAERLRDIPAASRPKVVLFGESLGAWTSQDAFLNQGTQGLLDAGVDYAIWIGTPHFSRWKEQVLRDERVDVHPDLIGVFNDIDEWKATPLEQRERMRYVMITHHNDGVARFGPGLIVQAPDWLGDATSRWAEIPRGMRWTPNTTFFQTLVDMKNSANVVPGVFAATGHDYRGDLLPFFRAVLGIEISDEQVQRLTKWLQDRELMRSEWVKRHKTADTGLAASLVTTWMREDPDRATQLILERVRELAVEDFVAAGGEASETPILRPAPRQ